MKKIFACFLCLILVAIPLVQRSYAVVTTTTVVVILILTLLTAMGITLVIAEGTKEAFIEQKGDEFMQSKGYSGSFSDWIKGQSDIQIGLKVGFFMLAKEVVDRIKEFIDWLIPDAASDTVVDLGGGQSVPTSAAIIQGTITESSSHLNFIPSSVLIGAQTVSNTFTDNVNTVTLNGGRMTTTGFYDSDNTFVDSAKSNSIGSSFRYVMYRNTVPFVSSSGLLYPVGIYLCYCDESTSARSAWWRNAITGPTGVTNSFGNRRVFLSDAYMSVPQAAASAIIGDYDDLSDLTQTTVTDNGTTTIYNTFYISQDGQALGTGQDLADIVGALQQALDDLNRRLEVIPQTAATAAEGTVTPDYSDFNLGDLDLSGLGALLTTRFPFSIPWDFVRIFTLFSADPVAPSWEVDLLPLDDFENVDTTVTLDLGQYPIVGQVSRWFCIIDLCLGLCYITKRLIWVA